MEFIFRILQPIAVMAMMLLSVILLGWLRGVYHKMRTPGYGRDLSGEEYEKIEDLAEVMWNEAEQTIYPGHFHLFTGAVAWIAVCAISVGLYWVFYQYFRSQVLDVIPPNAEYVFARRGFSFSGVLALLAGAMVSTLGGIFLAKRSPLVMRFQVFEKGWNQLVPGKRDPFDFCEDVLHLYYRDEIDLDDKNLDVDNVVTTLFMAGTKKTYVAALFFVGLFLLFFRFDLYWYEWQKGDKFVKNAYFSTKEVSFNVDEIAGIERVCRITSGKKGKPKSHFEYWVTGPDGVKMDLGHEPWNRVLPIENYAVNNPSLYSTLYSAPVRITKAPVVSGEPTMETCIKYLAHEYDPIQATLLSKVYGVQLPGSQVEVPLPKPEVGLRGLSPASMNPMP